MFEHFWIWLVTFGFVASVDLRKSKSPFDDQNLDFHYWRDWLKLRVDDLAIKLFLSLAGLGLADEIGVPLLDMWFKSIGWEQELALETMKSAAVFIVILTLIKLFGNKKDS